ncbi:hypothetical protein EDB89DRAFT_1972497 [Lactarius sanguifluus]|nr:hypothetical protein EDB89DRAFT_2037499 [Lactarius sanguifluus]KAH9171419.1 hypothetical protein EDB89DRAFT_1972497 [Lactarius sanguifluus]
MITLFRTFPTHPRVRHSVPTPLPWTPSFPTPDCVNHATAPPPPPARLALDTFRWRVTNDATPAKRATRRECPQPAQRRSALGCSSKRRVACRMRIRLAWARALSRVAAWEGIQRAIVVRHCIRIGQTRLQCGALAGSPLVARVMLPRHRSLLTSRAPPSR